jgi:hypothetical protein
MKKVREETFPLCPCYSLHGLERPVVEQRNRGIGKSARKP